MLKALVANAVGIAKIQTEIVGERVFQSQAKAAIKAEKKLESMRIETKAIEATR